MKNIDQINSEIDKQLKDLKNMGVEPKVLILGSISYATLKLHNKELQLHLPNEGFVLRMYKGLRVIQDPSFSGPGIYKSNDESVEVLGR